MSRPLIIAEVGVNHNGDLSTALELVDVAAAAGADVVKFQTFVAEKLATEAAPQARYQTTNTGRNQSQVELLKSLELTHDMHLALIEHCSSKGIEFLSTAFDVDCLRYLVDLGIRRIKIPSGELTNLPYLEVASSFDLPLILSTGMATLSEIKASCAALYEGGTRQDQLTILHCTTNYPAPPEELNMMALRTIHDETGVAVGYSDHSIGIDAAIIAVALGAKVIEKHITIDCSMPGPDHLASMEAGDFKHFVDVTKRAFEALGDGAKQPSVGESKNASIVRKSIVAAKSIGKGEVFSEQNLATKRPGMGLSPMRWHEVLGTKARRDFKPDELIEI